MANNDYKHLDVIAFIVKYIKDKFPMYRKSELELMNFASEIFNKLRKVNTNNAITYTNEEILNGDAWLFIDGQVEEKLKEEGISNQYGYIFKVLGIDLNIDDLKEDDFKRIRGFIKLNDSSEEVKNLDDKDKAILILLRKLVELGIDVLKLELDDVQKKVRLLKSDITDFNIEDYTDESFREISAKKQLYRLGQVSQLREILGDNVSGLSDDLLEVAVRETLFHYKNELKFDSDDEELKDDFVNKFNVHLPDFLEKYLEFYLNKTIEILGKKYCEKTNKYFVEYIKNTIMKEFCFGAQNENTIKDLFEQCEKNIAYLIKKYILSRYNDMPIEYVNGFIVKVMKGELGNLDKILRNEEDMDFSNKLRITMKKYRYRENSRINNERAKEQIKLFVDKLIISELPPFITKDDYVNYILTSSSSFPLGTSADENMYKLCFICYVEKYLKNKGLECTPDLCEYMYEKICKNGDRIKCAGVCNGQWDDLIDEHFQNFVLDIAIFLYFEKLHLKPSDNVIRYIYASIEDEKKTIYVNSIKESVSLFKVRIKHIYEEVRIALKHIEKYLGNDDSLDADDCFDYLISCGYTATQIKNGRCDSEIIKYNMKKDSVKPVYQSYAPIKKFVERSVPYLLIISFMLGCLGITFKRQKDAYNDKMGIVAEMPFASPSEEEAKHLLANYDDLVYRDVNCDLSEEYLQSIDLSDPNLFIHFPEFEDYFKQLSSFGDYYWMLLFDGIDDVLDDKEMDELIIRILSDKRCPDLIKSMFRINGESIPTYLTWKLNCLNKLKGGDISFSYNYNKIAGEVRQYYGSLDSNNLGTFVPRTDVDDKILTFLNKSYDEIIAELSENLGVNLVLDDEDMFSNLPKWVRSFLKDKYGQYDFSNGVKKGGTK